MTPQEPALGDRAVLVTEGAGFIRGYLVGALVDDTQVRVLDSGPSGDPEVLSATVESVDRGGPVGRPPGRSRRPVGVN